MTKRAAQPDPNERCHGCGHARHHHLPFGYCFACHETHDYVFCQVCHQEMRSHGFKEEGDHTEVRSEKLEVKREEPPNAPPTEPEPEHPAPPLDRKSLAANPEDP